MATVNYTLAEKLAEMVVKETGSVYGTVTMKGWTKKQQVAFWLLFREGTIVVSGSDERVSHYIKVCFGTDSTVTDILKWDGTVVQDRKY
jgi:hypothetical protein